MTLISALQWVITTCSPDQYVGPDIYQFWNFVTHPSFSYSKNTLDDKNLNKKFKKVHLPLPQFTF